jgi:tRNA(Ile)-lysidine synthase
MQELRALVRRETEAAGLRGRRILAAVSGGPDSVAMFHILAGLKDEGLLELHLCHVDHGWRRESAAREAALCARLAREAGVGWSLVHLPPPGRASEAQARAGRMAALRRTAEALGAAAIALGHQADDQAETVLLQLVRGTAFAGGMAVWRPPLWRPLLGVPRASLRQYCLAEGLAFADDPTNESLDFARNRMRIEVLPRLRGENPEVLAALGRFAAIRRDEDDWLEQQAARLVADLQGRGHALDLRPLREAPGALRRRALRQVLKREGVTSDADSLSACMAVLASDGRCAITRQLLLERGLLFRLRQPPPWCELPERGQILWQDLRFGVGAPPDGAISAEVGPGRITVRPRRPGDRLRLPGGTRKLQDILVDAKVPRPLRDELPVVCLEGRPVWLPGRARSTDAGSGRTVWAWSADVVAKLWSVLE